MSEPDHELRVFTRPYEVTSFWASTTYRCHHKPFGDGRYVDLVVDHPEEGEWCVLLCAGEDAPFVGEKVKPFLPTRANLRHLHAEVTRAGPILAHIVATQDFTWPKGVPDLLQHLDPSPVPVTRDLRDEDYQAALWAVLARDWGIVLPPLERLGRADITLQRRVGLPCAAAMERAVLPIFEAMLGPVALKRTALHRGDDGRHFDLAQYEVGERVLTQRYDITELFGCPLPDVQFVFD